MNKEKEPSTSGVIDYNDNMANLPALSRLQATSRLQKFAYFIELLAKLIGLITWPVLVLGIVLLFYSPIKQIAEKISEFSFGDFSVKVQEQAKALGNEELATKLEGLSPEAIEWILKLGDGSYRVIRSDDGRTGKVENYSIPPHYSAWKELAAKDLLVSTVKLDEYEKFFNSLGPVDGKIPVSRLTEQEEEELLNNSVSLSETGKSAYDIIIKVVADLIGQ